MLNSLLIGLLLFGAPSEAIEIGVDAGSLGGGALDVRGVLRADANPEQAKRNRGAISFSGNVIFENQFYITLIDTFLADANWELDEQRASALAKRVEQFLHHSGYELAQVRGALNDGDVHLEIDEGKLARVIFRGHNAFNTVRMRLEINIIENIYNRPALSRQLNYIRRRYGVENIGMRLVPTKDRKHSGLQIEDFGPLQGYAKPPEPGRYDLVISLGRPEWNTGFNLHVKVGGPDGVLIGTSYTGRGFVFADDRWRIRLDGGLRPFKRVDGGPSQVAPTRALSTIEYGPATIGTSRLRPFLHVYADLWSRQRVDLGIEQYYHYRQGAELRLDYEFTQDMRVGIALGVQNRYLFSVRRSQLPLGVNEKALQPFDEVRSVIALRAQLKFDKEQTRLDRLHQVNLDLENFIHDNAGTLTQLRIDYRKVFEFGWHDIWLRLRAQGMGGDIRFVDEVPVTHFLRGVFGDEIAVRQAAGASVEFRFSLARDLYKIGLFADTVIYQRPGRKKGLDPIFAGAAGPALHTLVLDTMQLNVYFSVGFKDSSFDSALYLGIRKAY